MVREINHEQYFQLLRLYNSLKIGFFKKSVSIERGIFCDYLGISHTNSISYNKILDILGDCVVISSGFNNKKMVNIDIRKLDILIRKTEQFKNAEDFIFKSTKGFAETGK